MFVCVCVYVYRYRRTDTYTDIQVLIHAHVRVRVRKHVYVCDLLALIFDETVSTRGNQRLHGSHMAVCSREMQRRVSSVVLFVDIEIGVQRRVARQESIDDISLAHVGGHVKKSPADFVFSAVFEPSLHEHIHHLHARH